jgi:methionyl-tRNA synthetase
MRNLLESIYCIAVLLSPALFQTAPVIIKALRGPEKWGDPMDLLNLKNLTDNETLGDMGVLFPRIEKEKPAEQEKPSAGKSDDKKSGVAAPAAAGVEGLIDISEFTKVDIRVAQVLSAERVEGSDKLLQLEVDSGLDRRTIVAGIAMAYTPEYLVGKKILLVANLKPAIIFKRQSNGMLLAAKKDKKDAPVLIEVDEKIPVGSRLG